MYEPCLCGDPECPACGPWYGEQAAAEEAAHFAFQCAMDEDAYRAEQAAAAEEAELYYRRYIEDGPDVDADETNIF